VAELNTNQFPDRRAYYHGTDVGIKGGVVKPQEPRVYRGMPQGMDMHLREPAAYATSNPEAAARHTSATINPHKGQGKLFGSVYEVEPQTVVGTDGDDKYGVPAPTGQMGAIADPKGLNVKRHAAFVSHEGKLL
jgi:hypothetical protein